MRSIFLVSLLTTYSYDNHGYHVEGFSIQRLPCKHQLSPTILEKSFRWSSAKLQSQDESEIPMADEMMAEIMAMGGDPFFAMPPDDEEKTPKKSSSSSAIMEDQMSEIDAMGGDSFFLSNEDDEEAGGMDADENDFMRNERMSEIEAMGGDSFFLTDDDLVEEEEEEEGEALSPEAFLRLATMAGTNMGGNSSPVMDLIDSSTKSSTEDVSVLSTASTAPSETKSIPEETLSSKEERISEIEAMGGDSFFFSDDDKDDEPSSTDITNSNDSMRSERISEIEAMGGDSFFLGDDEIMEEKEEEEEEALSPEAFMQLVTMAGSDMGVASNPVMDLIDPAKSSSEDAGVPSPSPPSFEESMAEFATSNSDEKFAMLEDQMRELEAAGGDPFFMDDVPIDDEWTNESDDFSAEAAEIDAMGGDSFFLMNDDDDDETDANTIEREVKGDSAAVEELKRFAMSGGGIAGMLQKEQDVEDDDTLAEDDGDSWEWDGTVDEEAHMGF